MSDNLTTDDQLAEQLGLPLLTGEARAQACHVKQTIIERIQSAEYQALPFAEVMSLCLYEPGLGYYNNGSAVFAAAGDFITAPTMGTLFAQTWANALQPLLLSYAQCVIEFGAGNGDWAANLVSALHAKGDAPREYHIVELSAVLAERQKKRIAELPENCCTTFIWHSSIEQLPTVGLVLANEVLDAMPQQRFVVEAGELHPVWVVVGDDDNLVEVPEKNISGKADQAGIPEPWSAYWAEDGIALADGLSSEYSPYLPGWLASLSSHFEQALVYLIDYGSVAREYYLPERNGGTMIAHYRHQAHDACWLYPGMQDISASVDFTAVAHFGMATNMALMGFTTQSAFLSENGLLDIVAAKQQRLQSHREMGSPEEYRLIQETQQLLMPGAMGERFKVMLLGIGDDEQMAAVEPLIMGFDRQDLSHFL